MRLKTYVIVMAIVGIIFIIGHLIIRSAKEEEKKVFDTFEDYKMRIHSIKDGDTLFLYYKNHAEFYSTQNLTKFKK